MFLIRLYVRLAELLLDALGRRSDRRTFMATSLCVALATALAGAVGALRTAEPELQYYATTALLLVGAIVGVLVAVALITWVAVILFHEFGRAALQRHYALFVGWGFLRSHQEGSRPLVGYEGGRRPPAALALSLGALAVAVAVGAEWVPWPRLLGSAATAVPMVQWGLGAEALLWLTWPLRPTRATGRIDRLDRLKGELSVDSDLRSVTATSFISIVGVGVGVWALIVVLSVMGGFENDLRQKILSTNPHVLVQDEEPMAGIPQLHAKLAAIRDIAHVTAAIPFVQGDVIISSRENRNVSLTLKGLDPEDAIATGHHLGKNLVSGSVESLYTPERTVPTARWNVGQSAESAALRSPQAPRPPAGGLVPEPIPGVDPAAPDEADEGIQPGILLGEELAVSLRVEVGDEVTLISPRDDAGFMGIQPRARAFRVAGIFRTGMYEFDLKLAYVTIGEAQRFFHMGGDVNRVELRLDDVERSEEVLASVKGLLDRDTLQALDWKRLNKNLFSALQLERIVMFVVLGFIVLVAAFNIVGSLFMIILEKSKEIAILKSMGATDRGILGMFLSLGGCIGVIGALSGLVAGLGTCWYIAHQGIKLPRQYYIELLPVHLDPVTVALVVVSALGVCLGASVYPALEARQLRPVEGLRYE